MCNQIKMKKIYALIYTLLFISCSSITKIHKYTQDRSINYYKKDTIYIYFKNHKFETKKMYLNDSTINYYQISYKFTFYKIKKYYEFLYISHRKINGDFRELPLIKKDKKFLKKIKNKLFDFQDFKKLSLYEINRFNSFNNRKSIFLIDKSENKNGKIYLKSVSFGGNFPRIQ